MVPEVLRSELAEVPSKGDGVYLGLKSDSNTVLGSELKTAPEKRFEFESCNFFSEGSMSGNCGDVFDDPNCSIISIRKLIRFRDNLQSSSCQGVRGKKTIRSTASHQGRHLAGILPADYPRYS